MANTPKSDTQNLSLSNTNSPSISVFKLLAIIFYDLLIVFALLLSATTLLFYILSLFSLPAPEPTSAYFRVYLTCCIIFYYSFCWRYLPYGQTIGMKAWKVSLVNNNKSSFTLKQSILRILGGILGFICFGLGYFLIYFNKQHKTFADLLSNSQLQKI